MDKSVALIVTIESSSLADGSIVSCRIYISQYKNSALHALMIIPFKETGDRFKVAIIRDL